MSNILKGASLEHATPPFRKNHMPEAGSILDAPKGIVETFGATPLDRMATLGQQLQTRVNLQELTYRDIPEDVPLEIIDYVHRTFAKRFDTRGEANEENFTTALHYDDYESLLDTDELAMVERAKLGQASPTELVLVRDMLGMKSIELACLTHPYGKHIKLLDEMQHAVWYAVELFGGENFKQPNKIFKIKESLNDFGKMPDLSKGILMTRKQTTGRLPDGTIIKKRSSFVLRTDQESGFDQEITARLERELLEDPLLNWMTWLMENEGIGELADRLLDADAFTLAIPISSTTYAYNKTTTQLIDQRQSDNNEKHLVTLRINEPEMYDAIYNNLTQHQLEQARIALESEILNLAGITYVGPRTDEELVEYLSSLENDATR